MSSNTLLLNNPPLIRYVDKARSAEPMNRTFSSYELRKSLEFVNVERLISHLKDYFHLDYHISTINRETILDISEVTTLDNTNINKEPVNLPSKFENVIHVIIGHGYNTGIGGVKYALFVVDRASRYKYIFKLKSLKKDTFPSFKQLITDMILVPKKIVTDFDHKLMGKSATDYLSTFQC